MKIKFDSNIEQNPDKDIESAISDTRDWALSIIKIKHEGKIPSEEKEEVERILNKLRLSSQAKMDNF